MCREQNRILTTLFANPALYLGLELGQGVEGLGT